MKKYTSLILLFAIALVLSFAPGILQAQDDSPQVVQVELIEGANAGLLTYEARGRGVASGAMIDITVVNESQMTIQVTIAAGTQFIPTDRADAGGDDDRYIAVASGDHAKFLPPQAALAQGGGGQAGGVAVSATSPPMRPRMQGDIPPLPPPPVKRPPPGIGRSAYQAADSYYWSTTLTAYCLNAHLDNPSADTVFTAASAGDDDLTRVLQVYNGRPGSVSVIAMQIAVWIVTDDIDLDFLESVGYSPGTNDLRDALLLLQEAGIDITQYQLGQDGIPDEIPPPPVFEAGQTTPVTVRGAVVAADGTPADGASVIMLVRGPEHTQFRRDFTTGRGRFEGALDLYESDTVSILISYNAQEIGRLTYSAPDIYDLFAGGGELIISLTPAQPPPTGTTEPPPTETAEPEPTEAPTQEPSVEPPPADATLLDPVLYGIHLNVNPANIRAEPNTRAAVVGLLSCGFPIVTLDAQTTDNAGFTWYRIQTGGWAREDVIAVYGSQSEAQVAAERNSTVCAPPPPPPPDEPAPTGDDQQGQPQQPGQPPDNPPDSGGGSSPPTATPSMIYTVTIINNAPCTISGALGPAGFSIPENGSANVVVPAGQHTLSAGGSCGSLPAQQVTIDGPGISFTIG